LVGVVGHGRDAVVVAAASEVGAGAGHEHGGVVGGVGVADRDDGLAVSGGVVVQQVVVLAGDPVGPVHAVFEYAQVSAGVGEAVEALAQRFGRRLVAVPLGPLQ